VPAKVKITGEIARIILAGDLDFSTQGNLSDAIDRALGNDVAKEIHVDMMDATFIDSSVIRALLNLQEIAKVKNKSLSIWNCNEQIREIFAIGGFDQMFVIH
jgi:anti-anti-sigma factor